MNLNDHLWEAEFQLEKYPGATEAAFLARRDRLRAALIKWGNDRYQDGYGDGRRDVADARTKAAEAAAAEEGETVTVSRDDLEAVIAEAIPDDIRKRFREVLGEGDRG